MDATPVVKVFTLLVGMFLGSLLQKEATDAVCPRAALGLGNVSWGIIGDVSAFLLCVVTFGPSVVPHYPWVLYYPHTETDPPCAGRHWGSSCYTEGNSPWYSTPGGHSEREGLDSDFFLDKDLFLPLQRLFVPVFVYSVAHGQGWISKALQASWLSWLGKYVYAFYVLHWQFAKNIQYPDNASWLLQIPSILITALISYLVHEYYQVWVQMALTLFVRSITHCWQAVRGRGCTGGSKETTNHMEKSGSLSDPLLQPQDTLANAGEP